MKLCGFLVFFLRISSSLVGQVTISGTISEVGSGETLPHVSVIGMGRLIAVSDLNGFYSVKLPIRTSTKIEFRCLGYAPTFVTFKISKDSVVNIELVGDVQSLEEVIIRADSNESIRSQDGAIMITTQNIKNTPALFGEKDPLKTIQLLPGMSRGVEGSSALYVRGGTPGQNLILLDDAPVYNAYHLFGFVSIVNADALKNVTFYKDAVPAKYGGRLSSVVDMQLREGSRNSIHANGGVGILSSRLSIESPYANKKGAFLLSGRRSYLDILTLPFQTHGTKQRYAFGDASAKISYDINDRNRIYLSSYIGTDALAIEDTESGTQGQHKSKASLGWRNLTITARWKFEAGKKTSLNSTISFTGYKFKTLNETSSSGINPDYGLTSLTSSIKEISVKSLVTHFLNNQHTIEAGLQYSIRGFSPRAYETKNSEDVVDQSSIEREFNREYSIFINDSWRPASWMTAQYGVRITGLVNTSFRFAEPRIGLSHQLPGQWLLSETYTRVNQFSHLLSNTGVGLPTDLWIPSSSITPPEQSDQFAFRVTKRLPKYGINLNVETFRKYMRNIVGYSGNASFVSIGDDVKDFRWQDNVVVGRGQSYGSEVMIEAHVKKLSAWLGYTLSWTTNQFTHLNNGKPFFPSYANRHNVSSLFTYHISPSITTNASWVYGSENYLTVPYAYSTQYTIIFSAPMLFPNVVPYYGAMNSYKAESYHRLDFSIQFVKQLNKYKRTWEVGVFNAYNRRNPFYYYLKETYDPQLDANVINLRKRSLFPILPYVSWNFEF